MEQDILRYLSDLYPEEGCGIILNRKGTLEWHPCDNIAEDKFNNFKIAAKDFVSLGLQGDIEAIVHSHPDSTCEASPADKKASDHLRIPYHIYSLPEIEKSVYLPVNHKRPLAGRVYDFKTANCYTLIRDYYLQEYNIELPMVEFEEDFYEKGVAYFENLAETCWKGVEVETPEKGDIVIFKIHNTIENHCGVYIGNGQYIHHMKDRLSCTESIYTGWGRFITRYIRCKK